MSGTGAEILLVTQTGDWFSLQANMVFFPDFLNSSMSSRSGVFLSGFGQRILESRQERGYFVAVLTARPVMISDWFGKFRVSERRLHRVLATDRHEPSGDTRGGAKIAISDCDGIQPCPKRFFANTIHSTDCARKPLSPGGAAQLREESDNWEPVFGRNCAKT